MITFALTNETNMRKLFIIAELMLFSLAQAKNIQYIDARQGYYYIYESGKSSPRMVSCNNGKLVGYSSKMCVLYKDGYYKMYDADGRYLGSVSHGKTGELVSVVDDRLISKKNGYVLEWNRRGILISERSVR